MKNLFLTTALALSMAATAQAQSTTTTTTTATGGAAMTAPQFTAGKMQVSADALIGKRVYIGEKAAVTVDDKMLADGVADASTDWDDMGEIGDILISADGTIGGVVIDAGGFLGIGEREVRVGLDDLKFVRDSDNDADYFVVYTGDRATLEGTPMYDRSAARTDGSTSWSDGMARTTAAAPDAMARPDRTTLVDAEADVLTAEALEGARVYGSGQDWIGDVGQLVLAADGKVTHMVIDVGGWLGMGEHPVALTFDQVDVRRSGSDGGVVVYVDYTQSELEAMPAWKG